jgi:hypothetical protein
MYRTKKYLIDMVNWGFWNKNDVKCNINIKNINPTPKSITHKKPIYISQSFIRHKIPTNIRYIPETYSKVVKFIVVM